VIQARLPDALVLPAGFTLVVLAPEFATLWGATASFAGPLVVALAVAGLLLSPPWREGPPPWVVAAAVGTFAVFAAPIVLSGQATFAGYIKLDDTATYFAMTDRVMEHARNLAGLAPSTYEATLATTIKLGYPTGGLMPIGIGHQLLAYDIAWLYQPYLAFMAALLALTLYALLERVVEARWLRAVFALLAAQTAVLYGYVLWGGVKEIAGAWLVALVAALAAWTLGARGRLSVLPLAAACATLACIESLPGSVWLGPLFLAIVVLVAWQRTRDLVERSAIFAVATAIFAIPAFVAYNEWRHHIGGFRSSEELGNLIGPLSGFQVFGIWPNGDFRLKPQHMALTYVLIAVVIAAALAGAWWAWRRRSWGLLVHVALAGIGALLIVGLSSPWVGGKALAIASPAFVALALAACGAGISFGRLVEASVVAVLIGAGVLWSNVLQYHDVWLAPRGQLHELETIGRQFAGVEPALMTTYEPYGVRHFLRNADPEGASELRRRFDYLRNGKTLDKGGSADIDRFRLDQVLVYRMLVLRRGPAASRPPSAYTLAWQGRYYEAWVRPVHPPRQIVEHLSLGDATQAGGVPRCADVLRLAQEARGGSLLYAVAPVAVPVTTPPLSGTVDADANLSAVGRYTAWLAGDWYGNATVWVDGRKVGSKREELNWPGLFTDLGTIELSPGPHRVRITVDKGGWHPGSGGDSFSFGPLTLSPLDTRRNEVDSLPPSQARTLCGRRLDWIEAVR
jgi:hypothetical protein